MSRSFIAWLAARSCIVAILVVDCAVVESTALRAIGAAILAVVAFDAGTLFASGRMVRK